MAIRYFIDLDCTPRRELGADGIMDRLMAAERASILREQFHETAPGVADTDIRFTERVLTGDDGEEERQRSVADLLREAAPLANYQHHCESCPATFPGMPFGCAGAVGLPITAAGERWLLDQLGPEGSHAEALLLQTKEAFGYGGNPLLANWRRAGILEGREPAVAECAGGLLTSEDLLEDLFLTGGLPPARGLGVLLLLGAIRAEDGRDRDALMEALERVAATQDKTGAPMITFALGRDPDDDPTIRDFKELLFALYRAFTLQATLAIRL